MIEIELEVLQLRSGGYWAKPADSCGNVGWHPIPWTMTWGRTKRAALQKFIDSHAKPTVTFKFKQ